MDSRTHEMHYGPCVNSGTGGFSSIWNTYAQMARRLPEDWAMIYSPDYAASGYCLDAPDAEQQKAIFG